MPTSKKIFTVANLAEKLKQAKGLVLSDYRGLNVAQMAELREAVKKSGGEFEVVKNTLFRLAAKNFQLEGPTAALWVYQDDPSPLKVLDRFIQKSGLPKIKTGLWNGRFISPEKVRELAKLPGLAELRAKLVGSLQTPIYGLANSLKWNINGLIQVLRNYRVQKEKGGG